jgi:hypothetical protein
MATPCKYDCGGIILLLLMFSIVVVVVQTDLNDQTLACSYRGWIQVLKVGTNGLAMDDALSFIIGSKNELKDHVRKQQ